MTIHNHFTLLGGNGFIGKHLQETLAAQNIKVVVPGADDNSLYESPLGNVIYCIGMTHDYLENPHRTIDGHVSKLSRLLEAGNFSKLIYLSSTRLYDSIPFANASEETDLHLNPLNKRHLYDLSKALGESLCLNCQSDKIHIARLSCVYSFTNESPGFLPSLLRQALKHKQLDFSCSIHNERDYIHIDDVVSLLLQIATSGQWQIYNIASGSNISNLQLFNTITSLTNCEIQASNKRADHCPIINIERIQREFHFRPQSIWTKIQQAIEELNHEVN